MSDYGPDGPPPTRRKQMNVRLPEPLISEVDTRRNTLGLSRDQWVERALRWALSQPHGGKPRPQLRRTLARNANQQTSIGRKPQP